MNCIIVEDEIMARKSLEKFCESTSDLNLIGSFENAEASQDIFNNERIDLLLLDIEMPGMSGLELIETLPYLPQIVFTTSNKEYAYDAYEYDVTDFLKKPITQPRFLSAIEKVISRKNKLNETALASAKHELYIKTDGQYIRLPYETILYFENVGDYVKVITTLGTYVIYGSLKSIDAKIKNPRFIKVHRSFIINMDKIKDIEDNTLVIEKKVIPISRSHKPILMKSINLI